MTATAVHHEITGNPEGEVLVLSGSLGSDLTMWDPQVGGLGKRFRIVRYDHRGHGRSPVPDGPYTMAELGGDVIGLLDDLEVERAHFCGLSLGGMVGMWLASNTPERLGGLVLCCTASSLPPASAWHERAALVRREGMDAVAEAVVERWFTEGYARANPDRIVAMRQMVLRTPAEGYAGCCEAIATMEIESELDRVVASTLVIAGSDDPATPPATARDLAERIPDARVAVVDDAAHLANVEQPEQVTGLVLSHLTTIEGAQP